MWKNVLASIALIASLALCGTPARARALASNTELTAAVCPPAETLTALPHTSPPTPFPPILVPHSSSPPRSRPAAPNELIACVSATPIYGLRFDHWVRVALLSFGRGARHHLHALDKMALDFLVQADWIIGEAAALGISISDAELHRRFVHLRTQQFPRRREFRSFLRSSGQTVGDLLLRTRVEMLSSRIMKHVLAGKQGKRAMHTFIGFAKQYMRRWRAMTYCRARYATTVCGHRLPAI